MVDNLIKDEDEDGNVHMVERWIGGKDSGVVIRRRVDRPQLYVDMTTTHTQWTKEGAEIFAEALAYWARTSKLSKDDDEAYTPNTYEMPETPGFVDFSPPNRANVIREMKEQENKRLQAIAEYEAGIKETGELKGGEE